MIDRILSALQSRPKVQAWTVREIGKRDTQLYAVSGGIESKREVVRERYEIDVLCDTSDVEHGAACGSARVTVLPGDEVAHALDEAQVMADLVHNPPYTVPAPGSLPDVPLADPELQADPAGTLEQLYERLTAAVARQLQVKVTAAELFGGEETVRLINSRGIDAAQTGTRLALEWVLIGRSDAQEVESFFETTRRRVADLDLEDEVERRARYTRDLLTAGSAPDYVGAVVLRDSVLAGFFEGAGELSGDIFRLLSSAQAKFNKVSPWEIGQPIFRREVTGDALTLWANRALPYGTDSDRFDGEGLPAQRVELIKENRLVNFTASQRYADYLSLPPTGAFGNFELAAGQTPAGDLLQGSHVEIAAFSWFNPNPATGDFSCEIRLGYKVDGDKRTPFHGGALVGNVLDALADVRYSAETNFYGDYVGPTTARFEQLKVAGAT